MHLEDNDLCINLSRGLWCWFYSKSTSYYEICFTCIKYMDVHYTTTPHMPLGGFVAHILRVIIIWRLIFDVLWPTCVGQSTIEALFILFQWWWWVIPLEEATLHIVPCYLLPFLLPWDDGIQSHTTFSIHSLWDDLALETTCVARVGYMSLVMD